MVNGGSMSVRILAGHVLDRLQDIEPNSVQVCVTSPPYFNLRSYQTQPQTWPDGWVGELGQEETLARYLDHLLMVFDAVRRVLRDDGTLWVNIASSYASGIIESEGYTLRDDLTDAERSYVYAELAQTFEAQSEALSDVRQADAPAESPMPIVLHGCGEASRELRREGV
jgi:hypothetical protein